MIVHGLIQTQHSWSLSRILPFICLSAFTTPTEGNARLCLWHSSPLSESPRQSAMRMEHTWHVCRTVHCVSFSCSSLHACVCIDINPGVLTLCRLDNHMCCFGMSSDGHICLLDALKKHILPDSCTHSAFHSNYAVPCLQGKAPVVQLMPQPQL